MSKIYISHVIWGPIIFWEDGEYSGWEWPQTMCDLGSLFLKRLIWEDFVKDLDVQEANLFLFCCCFVFYLFIFHLFLLVGG